jgi:hypothetical protein
MKSVLQPLEASVELAIPRTPNSEFGFMLLVIKPSKGFQLTDLGIPVLNIDA